TFFRKSIFERYGLFDARLHYCMDLEFMLRIGRYVKTRHIPALIGRFRVHDTSKSGTVPHRFIQESGLIRAYYSRGSVILRSKAWYGQLRNRVYVSTRRIWLSPAWSRIRRTKRL